MMTEQSSSRQMSDFAGSGNFQQCDPYALMNFDHPGMNLTNVAFNGSNYLPWSRQIRMALGAKLKLGFVDGKCLKPVETDSNYERWVSCDYMVTCWILNSMSPDLSSSFSYAKSARELWLEIKERYGESSGPLVFQLQQELSQINQGNMTVAAYYTKLKSCWDELENICGLPDCTCGGLSHCTCRLLARVLEMDNRNKLMQFLLKLNDDYATVKSQILAMEPLPNINKAYHLTQQIEKQKQLNKTLPEAVAFSINQPSGKSVTGKRHCDHCNEDGHTMDQCFELVGYPDWYKGKRNKRGNKASVNASMEVPAVQDTPLQGTNCNISQEMLQAFCQEVLEAFKGKFIGAASDSPRAESGVEGSEVSKMSSRPTSGSRSHADKARDSNQQAGPEPSSRDHISGNRRSAIDCLGERSWHKKERPRGKRQTSWQRDSEWKQVEPVTFEAGAGQGCPLSSDRNRTDCHVRSHELKYQGKTGDGASIQPQKSDISSDCTGKALKSIVPEKGLGLGAADGPLALDPSFMKNLVSLHENSSVSPEYADHNRHTDRKGPQSVGGPKNAIEPDCSQNSECANDAERFDICPPKSGAVFTLKPSLLEKNREKRNQIRRSLEPQGSVLRDGMVLLKNYVSLSEQVKIVKECRRLGLDSGGFYQPGYRDGAKLNLKMMCLGKNWDPETSSYGDIRPQDRAKPPPIPTDFFAIVERSIRVSQTLIAEGCRSGRVEDMLPWMSPDICLVNFYMTSGRLGLHQDKDESKVSLRKGLSVVSISIGNSAEFLYGDQRDVDKAEKVILESGDVLIFGGKSRHVFHGISSVLPDTAPKSLLEEANLRPGRLNLTFREY